MHLIKDKERTEDQKAMEECFADQECFVEAVSTIEPAPCRKLVAVLHRQAQG